MNYQLDLTQFTCPLPLFTAKKALQKLESGSTLTLIINNSSSLSDFELLCEAEGFSLISIEKPTALLTRLMIRK